MDYTRNKNFLQTYKRIIKELQNNNNNNKIIIIILQFYLVIEIIWNTVYGYKKDQKTEHDKLIVNSHNKI
jgi:hypothetical protein